MYEYFQKIAKFIIDEKTLLNASTQNKFHEINKFMKI